MNTYTSLAMNLGKNKRYHFAALCPESIKSEYVSWPFRKEVTGEKAVHRR